MSKLKVNWLACKGHGLCAEVLPELMDLDDWGYPIFDKRADVPAELMVHAQAAVRACPEMALKLIARG